MREIRASIEIAVTVYDPDGVSDDEGEKQALEYLRQRGIDLAKWGTPELQRDTDRELNVILFRSL